MPSLTDIVNSLSMSAGDPRSAATEALLREMGMAPPAPAPTPVGKPTGEDNSILEFLNSLSGGTNVPAPPPTPSTSFQLPPSNMAAGGALPPPTGLPFPRIPESDFAPAPAPIPSLPIPGGAPAPIPGGAPAPMPQPPIGGGSSPIPLDLAQLAGGVNATPIPSPPVLPMPAPEAQPEAQPKGALPGLFSRMDTPQKQQLFELGLNLMADSEGKSFLEALGGAGKKTYASAQGREKTRREEQKAELERLQGIKKGEREFGLEEREVSAKEQEAGGSKVPMIALMKHFQDQGRTEEQAYQAAIQAVGKGAGVPPQITMTQALLGDALKGDMQGTLQSPDALQALSESLSGGVVDPLFTKYGRPPTAGFPGAASSARPTLRGKPSLDELLP